MQVGECLHSYMHTEFPWESPKSRDRYNVSTDNIKLDRKGTVREGANWIHLASDRDQW